MRRIFIAFMVLLVAACSQSAQESSAPANCQNLEFEKHGFTFCRFNVKTEKIALYLKDGDNELIGDFARLSEINSSQDQSLYFAMNGGMYHEDRRPVGLYIGNGKKTGRLQKRASNDNFGLLPNGVFWVDGIEADVSETLAFEKRFDKQQLPNYVTQSGPMLVIDNKLHKVFKPDSKSLNIRNGVGISEDKSEIVFAISNDAVNFHTFARFFRDEMKTPNALYLDGSVSKLYSKELNRADSGAQMGPIIAVFKDESD